MRTFAPLTALWFMGFLFINPTIAQNQVFTNANLVDIKNQKILSGQTIFISEGKIERISPSGKSKTDGYQVIDLQNQYLLPGLIDAHTHINTIEDSRRALESGVTTARSAGLQTFNDLAIRDMVRSGILMGPEILAAGIFVTSDIGEGVLADPRLGRLMEGVESEESLRQLVSVNIDRGVDVIKTRSTERAGLPDTDPRKQAYTLDQLKVIVEEAAKSNVPVLCHAHGDEGAYDAVVAGVRSIEHGTYLSEKTLNLMKEKGTFLVPTYSTVIDLSQPGGDYDDPVLTMRGRHMTAALQDVIKKARQIGVTIAAGADTFYGATSVTRISLEVANFVDLGFTPWEALATATTNASELLMINDRAGSIEVGLEADLIVVPQNPIEDIRRLHDVILVMSNGRVALNRMPFGK